MKNSFYYHVILTIFAFNFCIVLNTVSAQKSHVLNGVQAPVVDINGGGNDAAKLGSSVANVLNTTTENPNNTYKTMNMNESIHKTYPNPFKDILNLEYALAQKGNVNIILYDVNGQKIEELEQQGEHKKGLHSNKYYLDHLPKGIYFLQINTPDGQFSQKVYKM